MRKIILIAIAIVVFLLTISASAEGLHWEELFESEEVEFETLHTTGYILQGVTATGGTTRPGIGACNTHLGDLAICYTVDGQYLTTIEITDTGSHPLLVAGESIDVNFQTMEEAKAWMRKTGGEIKVLWVHGNG